VTTATHATRITPHQNVVAATPADWAITPNPAAAIGVMPMASSCTPIALPCTREGVTISSRVVW
jgi:hypothetical protein